MSEVHLTCQLLCATEDEADCVVDNLPAHIALTRAESGCLLFTVDRTSDPMIWEVTERFTDETAFKAHQARVQASDWGRATAGIERRYSIVGLAH